MADFAQEANKIPVAMPEPYGYQARTKEPINIKEWLASTYKGRYEAGQEDAGDVMAKQVGGTHYKGAQFQPWDIFMQYGLDPWSANVVKYILRFPKKAGKQDLEKAKHYVEYLLANYDKVYEKYYKETA
jgi:hypothetical protein